jgi:hypothetical protein
MVRSRLCVTLYCVRDCDRVEVVGAEKGHLIRALLDSTIRKSADPENCIPTVLLAAEHDVIRSTVETDRSRTPGRYSSRGCAALCRGRHRLAQTQFERLKTDLQGTSPKNGI